MFNFNSNKYNYAERKITNFAQTNTFQMKPNISTTIGTVELRSCIYNASGPLCATKEELNNIGKSKAGAIISKSSTEQYREGNPKPRYFENELGSINSMGLPNMGLDFYLNTSEELIQYEKPFFLSIAGLSLEENKKMLSKVVDNEFVSGVELNLSCPNVLGKPQTAYDFERTKFVLDDVCKIKDRCFGVKLPPYFDLIHFEQMAEILNQYPLDFITCINSIGNGIIVDIEKEEVVIHPKGGFGGIGGDYIKPTALANVRKFRQLLKNEISVIGCGGIKNGSDVFEHILCGASAVQVGTQLMREGVSCFERIENELIELMKLKDYLDINTYKGKLGVVNSM